jgi:hypothetical protein
MSIARYANDSTGPSIALGKSRSGTAAQAGGALSDGDEVGKLTFAADNGTNLSTEVVRIQTYIDGSAADLPGRISFSTRQSASVAVREVFRVSSDGSASAISGGVKRATLAANAIYDAVLGSGIHLATAAVLPADDTGAPTDNSIALGGSAARWSTVYAGTGAINTSDASLKQDVKDLDAAELKVASAIKGLIKTYRFIGAVAEKSDNARIHVGVIAQDVEQAFIAEGLDPRRYALFCEDTLEDGSKQLGIRYSELLAFVIAAI